MITLSINENTNSISLNSDTIVCFSVCGDPNADFIIQDVAYGDITIFNDTTRVNEFYPYDVVDRGQLDADGNYTVSISLKSGTYKFRAGMYCTIAEMDYCTQVSNTVDVTILETACTASYVCKQPLNGYEYDVNNCGGPEKLNSKCDAACGGLGCDSSSKLVKIGAVVVIVGVVVYCANKARKDKLLHNQ